MLAESIRWGEHIWFELLDNEMHWYCEDNGHIGASYVSRNLVDEMFQHCEDNAYIVVMISGWLIWVLCFIVSWDDLIPHCELVFTADKGLQRYNCIWLTYIEDVEQNILFSIEAWSGEKLSLCDELIWSVPMMFCIQKNFVQKTVNEPLRSWRVTRLVYAFGRA